MELVLERTLKIQRYRIIAEVAQAQNRGELHAVLLLAQERGYVFAKMVAEELLGNRPETIGKRLIQICVTHRLLKEEESRGKKNYILTEMGQTALEEEKIFIPERGTWEIWVTDDPLWASALVQIEVFKEPQARNEIKNQEELKKRKNNMRKLPEWLFEKLQDQSSITPLANRNADYRFDELETKGEVVTPDANITATLTILQFGDNSDLRFTGKVVNKECDYQEQHAMTFKSAWHQMLEQQGWLTRWRIQQETQQEVLDVSYSELKTDQERASFRKNYPISKPYLTDLDRFDNTIIDNVAIAPATPGDAEHWADCLLEWDTNQYVLKGDFEIMQNKVDKSFPDYEITFQEQSDFAQALHHSNPRAYWYLQAPLDWQI